MESLTPQQIVALREHANDVRQGIIRSLLAAGSGHSAGSLDMADVFAAFYFHLLRHDPKHPDWPDRDRLLLSCGHIAPVRYSAMAYAGYFPVEELLTRAEAVGLGGVAVTDHNSIEGALKAQRSS